jgi:hypothetical protein
MNIFKLILTMTLLSISQIIFAEMAPAVTPSALEIKLEASFKKNFPKEKIVKVMIEGLVVSEELYCAPCSGTSCAACLPEPASQAKVISGNLTADTLITIILPRNKYEMNIELKAGNKYILKLISVTADAKNNVYYLTAYEKIE